MSFVRRQRNWDGWEPDLEEALAHPVGHFRRRICGAASAGDELRGHHTYLLGDKYGVPLMSRGWKQEAHERRLQIPNL